MTLKNNTDTWVALAIVGLGIYFLITLAGWRAWVASGFMFVWAYNIITKK